MQHNKSTNNLSLEKQLKIKEKEIKNQQKLIKILTNDNKNIKSVIERYNLVDVNINLNDKLHEKEVEIKELQKQIEFYELKLEEHNLCAEKIKNLNEQILEYKKEIELQKIDIKKSYKNYSELKTKIDKYGASGEKLNLFRKTNRKNSAGTNFNIKTLKNSNKNLNNINEENENEQEKLSGNKTDRIEPKKAYFFYNKNYMRKSSLKNKNKKENSKNEVRMNKDGLINLLNSEELICIRKLFDDNEEKFSNFVKKINVIEKYIFVKEKEMNQTIKNMENKLKENTDLLKNAQLIIKLKTNELVKLNVEKKNFNENKIILIQKINDLNNSINEEKNKNLVLIEENSRIKNSIFNIEGIIGDNIMKEKIKNNNLANIYEEKKEINIFIKNNNLRDNINKKEGNKERYINKIEEEKYIINNKFFTIQPKIVSKNLHDKDN